MSIQRLQCPSCGANITTDGRGSLFCSYCGAKLRIKTGASGNPMAMLDGIKEDTSLMARRSALAHVEEELSRLEAEREKTIQSYKAQNAEAEEEGDRGCFAFAPMLLLFAGIGLVAQFAYGRAAQGIVGLALIGAAIAIYAAWGRADAARERQRVALKSRVAQTVAEIDAKVAPLRERAEGLKAEIDRSISEL